jgi:hypothetical protein
MRYDPEKHRRRSIRLKGYDYSQAGVYFVTICTQGRACLFGEVVDGEMRLNDAGRMVVAEWERLPALFPNVVLDAFVVMPNHIHGIVILTDPADDATDGATAIGATISGATTGGAATGGATTRVAPTMAGDDATPVGAGLVPAPSTPCACPVHACPIGSHPIRACPVHACPIGSRPIRACLVHACPIGSHPIRACPVHACPIHARPVHACPDIRGCNRRVQVARYRRIRTRRENIWMDTF